MSKHVCLAAHASTQQTIHNHSNDIQDFFDVQRGPGGDILSELEDIVH